MTNVVEVWQNSNSIEFDYSVYAFSVKLNSAGLKVSTSGIEIITGAGISITSSGIENTGVLSFQGSSGDITLVEGTGVSISGLTISNTGVLSFQGSTGDITLTEGTGISISGLTVTNSGVLTVQGNTGDITFTAGSGLSISGLTITNTGVLSFQSSTGDVTLTESTGITIDGVTIAVDVSYDFTWTGSNHFNQGLIADGNIVLDPNVYITGIMNYIGGTQSATLNSNASATMQEGAVCLSSGYTFTNNTGYSILVYYSSIDNNVVGNPGSSSGYTPLTIGYSSWALLTNGGYMKFASDQFCYIWFLLA